MNDSKIISAQQQTWRKKKQVAKYIFYIAKDEQIKS